MKKLMIALICGVVLMPWAAWGQKWIEPYTAKDGTYVEGHWQSTEERNREQYSTPGTINPYTGQVNPFIGGSKRPEPTRPYLPGENPFHPQSGYQYPGR